MRVGRRFGVATAAITLVVAGALVQGGNDPEGRPLGIRAPGGGPPAAGTSAAAPGIEVSGAVRHDRSRPLRLMEPVPAPRDWAPRISQAEELLPGPERAIETAAAAGSHDPVVQRSAPVRAMPAASISFDGISQAQQQAMGYWALPPDPNGDVGPNHYLQSVNTSIAVYGKTGTLLYGPAATNTLWSGAGGACEKTNDGDAVVVYDEFADRWLVSQFAMPNYPAGPFYQCVAVSAAPDPTGSWYRYEFKIDDTKMNDYSKFGVWPDGYYMSVNQFNGDQWAGARVVVFERSQMLTGGNAKMIARDLYGVDPNLGGLLPADTDGPAPPAGSPALFAQIDDDAWLYPNDQIELWAFDTDWATPSNSTFTQVPGSPLEVAAFDSDLCGYLLCIPQPGTPQKLDPLSDRLMWRLQYRNFGSYQTLVTSHSVDADGNDRAGVRWYELRDDGGGWQVQQQGTFSPDATNRWMPSAAMNASGDIAVGYSVSSGSVDPGIRYSGRVAGDPPGELSQGEAVLAAGGGHQISASGRWGDYSAMSVDPADGCTFWYTTQYYSATSTRSFRTRIGSFRLPGCGPSPGSDTTPPDHVTIAAFPSPLATGTATVSWSATDAGSGVASYDVTRREAAWNGEFGPGGRWQDATTATQAPFDGTPGTTSCFSVAARDVAGNVSVPSGEGCVTTPLDDVSLIATGPWERSPGPGHFLDTYSRSTRKGASLSAVAVRAERIWLLADRCRRCGSVDLLWNNAVVDHVSLRAPVRQKSAVFAVASFGGARTGTLRIRISSSSRAVRIDGIGIGRS